MSKPLKQLRVAKLIKLVKQNSYNYTSQSTYATIVEYDLLDKVKLQTHQLDWGFSGKNNLCEWIVDSPEAADDEEDHWMNVRPY